MSNIHLLFQRTGCYPVSPTLNQEDQEFWFLAYQEIPPPPHSATVVHQPNRPGLVLSPGCSDRTCFSRLLLTHSTDGISYQSENQYWNWISWDPEHTEWLNQLNEANQTQRRNTKHVYVLRPLYSIRRTTLCTLRSVHVSITLSIPSHGDVIRYVF